MKNNDVVVAEVMLSVIVRFKRGLKVLVAEHPFGELERRLIVSELAYGL